MASIEEEKPLLAEKEEKKVNSFRAGLVLSVILTMYTMSIMSTIPLPPSHFSHEFGLSKPSLTIIRALFSSIAAMETVCATVSVTLYNTVYESTVGTMKGAVFLMMSGFCILTVLLVLVFMLISRGSRVAYELYVPDYDILSSNGSVQDSGDRKSHTT